MSKRLLSEDYINGIKKGDRAFLARCITLVESDLNSDQILVNDLLQSLMPLTGKSIRIAISGVPGAGKSTLIEALGRHFTAKGKKIAVLAVDPSSDISRGSILGDKTRMDDLSKDPLAFIRPSPTGSSKSGITKRTRESILLCEAAGFEIIIIETVGVGQIETQVNNLVDFFLLVMLTGAGDELQMIKKGVMEIAELIVINKADGPGKERAEVTRSEMEQVVQNFPEVSPGWNTKVITASAIEKSGINEIEELIFEYHKISKKNGYFEQNRQRQSIQWMKEYIFELIEQDFFNSVSVKKQWNEMEKQVAEGKTPATLAAENLYKIFKSGT